MNIRIFVILAIVVALGTPSSRAAASSIQYDVVDLGFFDGTSINNSGEVAGTGPTKKFGVANAYLWNGSFIDLGSLGINASSGDEFPSDTVHVDSRGRVYGTSAYYFTPIGYFRAAFVWDGKMHAVPHPAKVTSCNAISANDSGDVVGICFLVGPENTQSFITSHGVASLFGPLNWEVGDINNSGEILIDDLNGDSHLLINGVDHALRTSFFADRLNNAGIVAGAIDLSQGSDAAYTDGSKYVDLGALPGLPFTRLVKMNRHGSAAGSAQDGKGTFHAVFYDPSVGLVDLNSEIDPGLKIILTESIDINDSGQILAYGGPAHAGDHTYVLTPRASKSIRHRVHS